MSMFRSPVYLDVEQLVPLANYHDIEVMVDVAISQRDRGQRTGKASIKGGLGGVASAEAGGSRGSETEFTQEKTVKDDPTSAMNRLLDTLAVNDGLMTDLSFQAVTKRQLVDLDAEWEISPATDIGSLLANVVGAIERDPSSLDSVDPPPELLSAMTKSARGPVVLSGTLEDANDTRVLALLNSDHLTASSTIDDLEGDRTLFGIVDTLVPEGRNYPLEKFFLSGFGRAIRRSINTNELLDGLAKGLGQEIDPSDMDVTGPLVVIKAIAVY